MRSESRVRSGWPCSSSSACAATPTARKKAPSAAHRRTGWNAGRHGGAERDVAQVPGRVRGMEDRDEVPPAARAQRVEGRAVASTSAIADARRRRPRRRGSCGAARTREIPAPLPELDLARERPALDKAPRCSGRGSGRPRTSRGRTPSQRGQPGAGVKAPEGPPQRRVGQAELQRGDPTAGLTTRASSAQGRRRVVDVAQQVGEGQVVELAVGERQPLGLALDQLDPRRELGPPASARRAPASMSRALVEARRPSSRSRAPSAARPGRCRSRRRAPGRSGGVDRRDHRPPPARVLPEAERPPAKVVAALEAREQRQRAALALGGDAASQATAQAFQK